MNLILINQYLGAIGLLLGICNAVWIWLSRPAAEMKQRMDDMKSDFDGRAEELLEGQKSHDRRIQRVEDDMRHLPTKDDLNELGRQVTGIETELSIMSRVVNRIDEALRNRP